MSAGLANGAAQQAEAERLSEMAVYGYAGSHLEARAPGLRFGLARFSLAAADVSRLRGVAAAARRRADLDCLTQAVYYEARSESDRGQAAVAQVVLNRVKHPAFPKSVCAVVFQGANHPGCQFSFTCDGSMRRGRELLAWRHARGVAARVMAGAVLGGVGSATHYHTTAVSPYWAPQMLRVTSVGAHVFYRFSPYRLRVAPALEPQMQTAALTGAPAGDASELRIAPTVEKAIEASLAPASADAPKAPAPKPAEAAMLTTPQATVLAAAS